MCFISYDYIQCALSCTDSPFLAPFLLPPVFSPHILFPYSDLPTIFLPSLSACLSPSSLSFFLPSFHLPLFFLLLLPLPPPRDSVDSGLLRVSKFDKSKRQDRPRPLLDVEARAHSRKGIDTQVQVRQETCSYEKIRIIAEFCTGCKLSRFFFFCGLIGSTK